MRRLIQLTLTSALMLLSGANAWSRDTLNIGDTLPANDYLQSNNGSYRLYMQGDGNLVLRNAASSALWATGTHGKGGVRVNMQGDGNLVMYTSGAQAVWATGTNGKGGVRATLRDDGNFVVLNSSNTALWSSNSGSGGSTDGGGSGGTTGSVSHVGTTQIWDADGQGVTIAKPANTQAGDLMVLVLHRTDTTLPYAVSGWTRRAECYKEDNGYQCLNVSDCTSFSGDYCTRFQDKYRGLDLAQVVFSRTAGTNEPSSYSFNLTKDGYARHPGWAILTTLRGANTTSPVRAWANKGCDGDNDSLFPSVDGRKGDMLLLSQSFDDRVSKETFGAPTGMSTFGYVANSDESGFLYGAVLTSDGPTGVRRTNGPGASGCKDALVSLTIKPQ